MNEDFGYLKDEEQSKISIIIKKCLLAGTVIFSILCFVYITINAYYFVYRDLDGETEVIKGPKDPIKVYEEERKVSDDVTIISDLDKAVYENIVGNKKESLDRGKNIRIPEKPAIPPSELSNRAKKEVIINTTERQITYDASKEEKKEKKSEVTVVNREVNQKSKNRVQLAAMNSQSSANNYWISLNQKYPNLFVNLKPYVQEVNLGQRGIFYRLQVGGFYDQVEAENFCLRFISTAGKTKADCIVVE